MGESNVCTGTGNLIDGKMVAAAVREEVKAKVEEMIAKFSQQPKLAVILVGERKDSLTYVGMKSKACEECKVESLVIRLPESSTQEEVEAKVAELNADVSVDGILVQLPLPGRINEEKVLENIHWSKDVDGLHPLNVGNLTLRGRTPLFKPCTAEGCIELCRRYGVKMAGSHVVVIGRSNIVGIPVSLLFQQENATVTMCHSQTQHLPDMCRMADIVIVAIGKPNFVKADWLREGAVVIDVGINAVDDATKKAGFRLVGDADFQDCQPKCKLITPVPGGVGPMTVAILVKNTLESRKRRISLQHQ